MGPLCRCRCKCHTIGHFQLLEDINDPYLKLVCRRKAFHFTPGDEQDLRGSDFASMSGGEYAPLDLGAWKEKFKGAKLAAMNFL